MNTTFTTRPASHSDLGSIVSVRNLAAIESRGTPITADHWQQRHWLDNDVNLATDSLVACLADGRVVGFVELITEPPYVLHQMTGAVHPAYRGQGIGSRLVQWAWLRAGQNIDKAPDNARLILHHNLFDSDEPGRALLLDNGFTAVREFVHLRLEMTAPPPTPTECEGIEIRPLQRTDWPKVGPALGEAFADHWGVLMFESEEDEEADEEDETPQPPRDPSIFQPDYFNSPGLCFVAWAGDEVAGSCLCNAKTVENPDAGYLGSLSIRRPWRRRGIGLALTQYALAEFYKRGTRQLLTDTDGESFTQAYNLYQKVGMKIYRREIVYEKEIRPGVEWLRREVEPIP